MFAAVCGHSYPLKAVSMTAGEKFAYFYCLLMHLCSLGYTFAFLEYDVACRFEAYLRKHDEELARAIAQAAKDGRTPAELMSVPDMVAGILLALGRFHAHAHQASCQVLTVCSAAVCCVRLSVCLCVSVSLSLSLVGAKKCQ